MMWKQSPLDFQIVSTRILITHATVPTERGKKVMCSIYNKNLSTKQMLTMNNYRRSRKTKVQDNVKYSWIDWTILLKTFSWTIWKYFPTMGLSFSVIWYPMIFYKYIYIYILWQTSFICKMIPIINWLLSKCAILPVIIIIVTVLYCISYLN